MGGTELDANPVWSLQLVPASWVLCYVHSPDRLNLHWDLRGGETDHVQRSPPPSSTASQATTHQYTGSQGCYLHLHLYNEFTQLSKIISLARCSPGQSLTSGEVSAEIQLSQSSKHSLSLQQTRTHVSLY